MKTTIDIPEELYRKAKIRAIESGQTLKSLMLKALNSELKTVQDGVAETPAPYFARRRLLPEFEALVKAGSLQGGTDSTVIVSEDRDSR